MKIQAMENNHRKLEKTCIKPYNTYRKLLKIIEDLEETSGTKVRRIKKTPKLAD